MELYGLVSIIDNYAFGDLPSFKAQYCKNGQVVDYAELKERIKSVCQRTQRKQVLEYIKYTNRIAITEKFTPTEEEIDKLEKWAEDRQNILHIELNQLIKEIKTKKAEARKIMKLEDKIKAQKEMKEMEAKRKKMQRELYEAEDLIEQQKDKLIDEIEAKSNQKLEEKELFTIRWRLI